jgi:hypothetical protein
MKMTIKLLKTMIALNAFMITGPSIADEAKPLIAVCPTLSPENLQTLANDGKISLDGKTYIIASQTDTNKSFDGRLIEDKDKLSKFLSEAKDKPTVTLNVNTHRNARMRALNRTYCSYKLETEAEIFVIALKLNTEGSQN